jgi:hypothetical protein
MAGKGMSQAMRGNLFLNACDYTIFSNDLPETLAGYPVAAGIKEKVMGGPAI